QDSTAWLCPCDCRVQDIGTIRQGRILTVKGIAYDVPSLLAESAHGTYQDGHFAILFLSPTDCHRVFSPQNCRIEESTHVPGPGRPDARGSTVAADSGPWADPDAARDFAVDVPVGT